MFPFLFYWTKVQQHQVSCSFYNCYQIHELIFIHIIFTDYSLCLWEFFLYGYCFSFFFFLSVIFLVKQYTCLVAQLYLTLCNPTDYSPPGSPSMGFSRQEYWSRLPCIPPGDLPNPGIEPKSSALQEDSLPSEPPGRPYYFSKCDFSCRAVQI